MKILDIPRSGSLQGVTSSRNTYGQYVRTRAMPTNPNTTYQSQQRARFGDLAAGWSGLTDAQRAGWRSLGQQIQRTDSLGQTYTLSGMQAYIAVNANNLDAGNSVVSDAPARIDPVGLLTMTVTTAGGTLSAAYTATPLGAGKKLFIYASPQRSSGRNYEGDLRLIHVSAAAAASPANILAAYTARFGSPVVGNKIFFSGQVYDGGFLSAPLLTSVEVAA